MPYLHVPAYEIVGAAPRRFSERAIKMRTN